MRAPERVAGSGWRVAGTNAGWPRLSSRGRAATRGPRPCDSDVNSSWPLAPSPWPLRTGFTLIELLVVISILLITTALTVALINTTADSDRIRSSARQLQAVFGGARDRAIHAGKQNPNAYRGVRLFASQINGLNVASSMVYIGSLDDYTAGNISLGYADLDEDNSPDDDNDDMLDTGEDQIRTLRGSGTGWYNLAQRGLLVSGARIQLPKDTGSWYTVDLSRLTSSNEILNLSSDFRGQADLDFAAAHAATTHDAWLPGQGPRTYRLELAPAVLPGQEPQKLSSGIVINLSRSTQNLLNQSGYIDILYSPRGTIYGPLSARGLINFYLCTQADVDNNYDPVHAQSGDKLIVTLFTQSGNVSTFPVDLTDAIDNSNGMSGADGVADDPFLYAKKGAMANR